MAYEAIASPRDFWWLQQRQAAILIWTVFLMTEGTCASRPTVALRLSARISSKTKPSTRMGLSPTGIDDRTQCPGEFALRCPSTDANAVQVAAEGIPKLIEVAQQTHHALSKEAAG